MNRSTKNSGFTLIELILSLTIIIILMIGYLKWEQMRSNMKTAENGGAQMLEYGKALAQYVATNQQLLAKGGVIRNVAKPTPVDAIDKGCVYTVSNGGAFSNATDLLSQFNKDTPATQTMTVTNVGSNGTSACKPSIKIPTSDILSTLGVASPANRIVNPLGFEYDIQIMNTQDRISALLISRTQVLQDKGAPFNTITNPINMAAAGLAVKTIGPQGGVVTNVGGALTLTGLNGSWTLKPTLTATNIPFFPAIQNEGQIGFRVTPVDSGFNDDQYLRIDGTNYMTGNLNAGNWDIQNATNISYNGWLTGYGILTNTINSGQINNAGDIFTGNDVVIGRYARMKDAYISRDQNTAPGRSTTAITSSGSQLDDIFLSEIVPQYVSKGVMVVGGFCGNTNQCQLVPNVQAPICPPSASPKVIVTPLVQSINGKTYGEVETFCENCGPVQDTKAVSIRLNNLQTYTEYGYTVQTQGNGDFTIYTNPIKFLKPLTDQYGNEMKYVLGLYDLALVQRFCDLGPKYNKP